MTLEITVDHTKDAELDIYWERNLYGSPEELQTTLANTDEAGVDIHRERTRNCGRLGELKFQR